MVIVLETARNAYRAIQKDPSATAEEEARAARAYITQLELRVSELEAQRRARRGGRW